MFVHKAAFVFLALAMPASAFVTQRAAIARITSLSADTETKSDSESISMPEMTVKVC